MALAVKLASITTSQPLGGGRSLILSLSSATFEARDMLYVLRGCLQGLEIAETEASGRSIWFFGTGCVSGDF